MCIVNSYATNASGICVLVVLSSFAVLHMAAAWLLVTWNLRVSNENNTHDGRSCIIINDWMFNDMACDVFKQSNVE